MKLRSLFFLFAAALIPGAPLQAQTGWQAGVAKVNITPQEPMWMTGYGFRNRPADTTLNELWVKALAIADPQGRRTVLLTADLCGITAAISDAVAAELLRSHELPRSAVMINVSHTHSGPFIEGWAPGVGDLPPEDWAVSVRYRQGLERAMVAAAREALDALAPGTLTWGTGRADFAVNRRNNTEAEVPALRAAGQLKGPVDHDVPVLSVTGGDGALKAVVFGYACHNTVLRDYAWTGDYAGFAQDALESRHPGATALYFAGCGGDINPLPRRSVDLARDYGRQLADAVDEVLGAGEMRPVEGALGFDYTVISLRFSGTPTREELESDLTASSSTAPLRARHLLRVLDERGRLPEAYPYPVQVWRLGRELTWVALGGEVVIDYALRLKRELGPATFVAGYSNDVMGYIPSERVLQEGGYEGATSMNPYALPAPWAPGLEDKIVSEVRRQAAALNR